ncbi:MAG: cytochrome c biogenesis protein CcdA [Pseudomonadota bacterium]
MSLMMAFAAGLISFLSPCVLPLVPGYVSFVSGAAMAHGADKTGKVTFQRKRKSVVLLSSALFVAGFSVVFVLLGASATWMGAFITSRISMITRIAGLVIIFFGLLKLGLIRTLFFYREAKFHFTKKRVGFAGAFLIGASFAFGWTPCIGPILAGILTYAGTLDDVNRGVVLLLIYSMGLGIPFLLTALGINHFFKFFDRMKKHLGLIEKISGAVMVALGLLIFLNKINLIPGYLSFLNWFAL